MTGWDSAAAERIRAGYLELVSNGRLAPRDAARNLRELGAFVAEHGADVLAAAILEDVARLEEGATAEELRTAWAALEGVTFETEEAQALAVKVVQEFGPQTFPEGPVSHATVAALAVKAAEEAEAKAAAEEAPSS